jgi:hypothetical protein
MNKKAFLFFYMTTSLMHAQNVKIAGKFPYQRDVHFSIELVDNQVIFHDSNHKTQGTSDDKGFFKASFDLEKPSILQFTRQGTVELYLKPGDSLWIEMINPRNLHFEGSAALENKMLTDLGEKPDLSEAIEDDPAAYMAFVDSVYNLRIQALTNYEASRSNADFVQLYKAKIYAYALQEKIETVNKLERIGLEGALLDKLRRQLRAVDFVDDTRDISYLQALNQLFIKETLDLMGHEMLSLQELWNRQYPAGFMELLQNYIKERLVKYPVLAQHFEAQQLIGEIQGIQKREQLAAGGAALTRLQQLTRFVPLARQLQFEYRKKVIMYQLGTLPQTVFKTSDDEDYWLTPSPNERTLLVFWNPADSISVEAYKNFQAESINRIGFLPLDTEKPIEQPYRYIWVQYGASLELWKKTIAQVANKYPVQHFYLDNKTDLETWKPYFFREELPIVFRLKPDLGISSIGAHPSPGLNDFYEIGVLGGMVFWRTSRE